MRKSRERFTTDSLSICCGDDSLPVLRKRREPGISGRTGASVGAPHSHLVARKPSMQSFVPKELFLTKGVGVHRFRLSSFEDALRNAGVANQNIVSVSSILPP